MPQRRRNHGDQGKAQHHGCDYEIEPGNTRKDQQRRQKRDRKLWQILTEIDLELFDAINQG